MSHKLSSIFVSVLAIIAALAVIFIGGNVFLNSKKASLAPTSPVVATFEECVLDGNISQESYPRQCTTPEGNTFIENIGNELDKLDLIQIESPRPNERITSPFLIQGEARGVWFFEGSFPVTLKESGGAVIARGFVTAQDMWMTEKFVPFTGKLEFNAPSQTNSGTLVLQKNNPSDFREHDDALEIPVYFEINE